MDAFDRRPILTFDGRTYRFTGSKATHARLPDGHIVLLEGWMESLPAQVSGSLTTYGEAAAFEGAFIVDAEEAPGL